MRCLLPDAFPMHQLSRQDKNARNTGLHRCFGLSPVNKAPSLITFNGFGFKSYGYGDVDLANDSHGTTHYWVVLFVSLAPLARYWVIQNGNQFGFLGKGKLRPVNKVHLGLAALLVA